MTTKPSCSAWLPWINAATSIRRRNAGRRSNDPTPTARSCATGNVAGQQIRHPPGAPCRDTEQNAVQPDDRDQSEPADRLARQQRAQDERGRSGAPHPAIFEASPVPGLPSRPPLPPASGRRRSASAAPASRMRHADQQERPNPRSGQVNERHARRRRRIGHQHQPRRPQPVRQPAAGGTRHQPHRGPGGQDQPDGLRPQPPFGEKRGKERRRHPESREQRRVQRQEARQGRTPSRLVRYRMPRAGLP